MKTYKDFMLNEGIGKAIIKAASKKAKEELKDKGTKRKIKAADEAGDSKSKWGEAIFNVLTSLTPTGVTAATFNQKAASADKDYAKRLGLPERGKDG